MEILEINRIFRFFNLGKLRYYNSKKEGITGGLSPPWAVNPPWDFFFAPASRPVIGSIIINSLIIFRRPPGRREIIKEIINYFSAGLPGRREIINLGSLSGGAAPSTKNLMVQQQHQQQQGYTSLFYYYNNTLIFQN